PGAGAQRTRRDAGVRTGPGKRGARGVPAHDGRPGRDLDRVAAVAAAWSEAMKAAAIGLILFTAANAVVGTTACPPTPKPGDPLRGLTNAELARFEEGRAVFERTFAPETGLGPLFNADACAECHEDPVGGGTGDEVETHVARLRPDGICDPLAD